MKSVLYGVPMLALSLVACSTGKGHVADPPKSATTITTAPATTSAAAKLSAAVTSVARPTSSPAPVATTAPPSSTIPSTSKLPTVKAQVLALDDLPTGWKQHTIIPSDDSTTPKCLRAIDSSSRPSTDRAAVSFQVPPNSLPSLYESIDYAPQVAAEELHQALRSLDSCHMISIPVGPATLAGMMRPMSFPSIGDESKAYQVVLVGGSKIQVTLGIDILVTRVGDEDVTLLYSTLGVPTRRDFTAVVKLALDKMNGTGRPA